MKTSFLVQLQTCGLTVFRKGTPLQMLFFENCEFHRKSFLQNTAVRLLLVSCNIFSVWQGSTVIIKSPYVITYMCQNFGVRDVRGQMPKSIYQATYLLLTDFPNNIFPKLVLI